MEYTYTTQREIRRAFWGYAEDNNLPVSKKKIGTGAHKFYNTDTSVYFNDFVDMLYRNREISQALAYRVTLEA